jgi:putative membrane protein
VSEAPRRLHPGTIAISLVKSAPSTLVGMPALLTLATDVGFARVALFTLLGIAVAASFTWVGWRSFTYAIEADALVIARGVFSRSRRAIPLERIQDVSIEQKPLARVFDLALVRIETGGGDADEATLDSVHINEAHRLRAAIRRAPAAQAAAEAVGAEEPVFSMSASRVLFYGLFNFSLLWLAAIFGALQTLDGFVDLDWRELLGVAERGVRSHLTPAAILSAFAAALALGVAAGLVRTFAREFGFRLVDLGERFRRVRGLLTRSEVVVAKDRIQLALVHRPLLRRKLGWESLSFQTLGGSDDASGRQEVAPFARPQEVARVVAAAGLPSFEAEGMEPVARGHAARAAIRHGVPPALAFGVGGCFFPPAWLGLLVVPMAIALALHGRSRHRYALRETSLQVTRGVVSRREWLVPRDRVQSVTIRRSWLQRRFGLATLEVDTAGGRGAHRPDIVDVRETRAAELAMALIGRA